MTPLPDDMAAELGRLDAGELSEAAAEVNSVLLRYPGIGMTGRLVVLGSGMLAHLHVAGRPQREARAVLEALAECAPRRRVQ